MQDESLRFQWQKELSNSVLPVFETDLCKSIADDGLNVLLDVEPGVLYTVFTTPCGIETKIAIPMRKYQIEHALNIVRMLKQDGYVVYVCEQSETGDSLVGGYKPVVRL